MHKTLTKADIYSALYSRHNGNFLTLKDLPYPNSFKDMDRAVKRVVEAINRGEKIALIGDYDVDGVVSTTVIRELFKAIDYPLFWKIPNRFMDGYGISPKIVQELDASLVITVDNGIAAIEAAKVCKDRGIDLIITDHHTVPPVKPEAFAIVNQKQDDCKFEYKEICGAQIAWYFAAAVAKGLNKKLDTKALLGIVSLAIVADIMPLTQINRVMLIAGMEYLKRSKAPFIKALREKEILKNSLRSETIAFYLAPLLNSAGRLKDASIASNFLFTNSLSDAHKLLEELISLNQERKAIEREITKKALKQVNKSDSFALVWGSDWNEGVVGIVASKVAEYFKVPAIVLSCKDGICKGSGRSYGDCDLYSLVSTIKDYCLKFGGHKNAIGLSFKQEKLNLIKSLLNIEASRVCNKEFEDKRVLGILPFTQIDFELLDILDKFEPYGEGNLKPLFLADVDILDANDVGESKEHRRYRFKDSSGKIFSAIEFRSKKKFNSGDRAKLIFSLSKNEYNGNIYINLFVEELQ